MSAPDLSRARWRKSTYSGNNGGCVEVAFLDGGQVAVRDTKQLGQGPVLVFTPPEWDAFLKGAKAEEFDPD
ncbi:MAG: DUF397 domain-containing protein [Actinobacteria bacterium]|nr:DUF397 domain-containing protein [Actinomycetota bacterium]